MCLYDVDRENFTFTLNLSIRMQNVAVMQDMYDAFRINIPVQQLFILFGSWQSTRNVSHVVQHVN